MTGHLMGALEEGFGDHGKKLCGVGGAGVIHQAMSSAPLVEPNS